MSTESDNKNSFENEDDVEAGSVPHDDAPEGWLTAGALIERLEFHGKTIGKELEKYKEAHPEWFRIFRHPKTHNTRQFYAPELVSALEEKLKKREKAPPGWITVGLLAEKIGFDAGSLKQHAEANRATSPNWFKFYNTSRNQYREHISPELAEILEKKISQYPEKPADWKTAGDLQREFKTDWGGVQNALKSYRETSPEWIKKYKIKNGIAECYAPELVAILKEKHFNFPPALPGWYPTKTLAKALKTSRQTIKARAEKHRAGHPDWFKIMKPKKSAAREHYAPELCVLLTEEFSKFEPVPDGWIAVGTLAPKLKTTAITLGGITAKYRETHPDWFKKYKAKSGAIYEYYSPELITALETEIGRGILTESLETGFKNEAETIANDPELLNKFKIWVSLFGPQSAADILFAHNPQYRGVREEFVKGIIADYLGDSLVQPVPFIPANLEFIEKRFLENPNLQEGLYTCLIQACSLHLSKQRANPDTAANILEHFMVDIGGKIPPDAQDIFIEIIVKVATYFRGVFDNWKRPENMVGNIVEGRDFPDTTQIINILEIKEKQRILIADRMGVGKSASAIAAKEFLELKQALVVVPANVIPTWQKYLSRQKDGGYFLDGREPKVFVATSAENLLTEESQQADYVIVSQERLNDEYRNALKTLDSQMLIVDEVHKLKSSTGVRSEVLHDIAGNFEGPDKYVALLSGTPAPNKVSDIAGILKLLYPERFAHNDVKTIARQIIYGDITDLRALLVPRMQRKTLAEVVEMPKLIDSEIDITLSPWFEQAYEVILQDDELTSSQKIMAMRQILLNPSILELQPPTDKRLDKIEALEGHIEKHATEGRKKIVVIFNDYLEGVTRGDDNLVWQVKLPEGFELKVIDGTIPMTERKNIETEFNSSDKAMVLYLSGNTADVGIDLSGANVVIEYNEPWSKETKAQQIGRSYRPGLANDLFVETFITEGTIEEGIHHYIDLKDKAIQKLFIGVELTELEKRLLEEDDSVKAENFEVDSELATYYLNSFQDLLSMFKSVKNIGEARFSEFLAKYGERYAGNYEALGDRSYQSNVARLTANIISRTEDQPKGLVVDLASGPEMLKNKSLPALQDKVVSMDINPAHFLSQTEQGKRKEGVEKAIVAGMTRLPLANDSVAAINLSLALHYTSFRPSLKDFERVQVICEMNRVLKEGGRAVITLQHGANFKDRESFENFVSLAGFEIDTENTGEAQGENFQAEVYTLVKTQTTDFPTLIELIAGNKTLSDSLKLKFDSHTKSFKDTRKILTQVKLGNQYLNLELNEYDRIALAEEQQIYQLGEILKQIHTEIKNIPVSVLREHRFARIKLADRYILFKNLEESKGVVLIKG